MGNNGTVDKIELNINMYAGFATEWLYTETTYLTVRNIITFCKVALVIFIQLIIQIPELYDSNSIVFFITASWCVLFYLILSICLVIMFRGAKFVKMYTFFKNNNYIANNKNTLPTTIRLLFNDDNITSMTCTSKKIFKKHIPYNRLNYILLYDDFIVIHRNLLFGRFEAMFYKDQLNCSWEEFTSFIQEKNPKVKIKPAKLFHR